MREPEKPKEKLTQEASSSPISYPETSGKSREKGKETQTGCAPRAVAQAREERRKKALGAVAIGKVAEELKVKQGEKIFRGILQLIG